MTDRYEVTLMGEPASKANSREIVLIAGRYRVIKSAKARRYAAAVAKQAPIRPFPASQRLRATIRIWYASERPDLDPSLILDGLQGRAYTNDRQVREMHLFHSIDRENPRAHVLIEPIA